MREKVNPRVLDATELARLHEDFDYYDRNDDGLMEYDEFVHFLKALNAGMSESESRIGFAEIDADHDGVIEFSEFANWWGEP